MKASTKQNQYNKTGVQYNKAGHENNALIIPNIMRSDGNIAHNRGTNEDLFRRNQCNSSNQAMMNDPYQTPLYTANN